MGTIIVRIWGKVEMKINLKKTNISLLYMLLLLAFANASLRFNQSGYSTFYRLIAPIVVISIISVEYRKIGKAFIFCMFAMTYSIVVSALFYHNIMIAYHINLVYIIVIFLVVYRIKNLEDDFDESFFRFLNCSTAIILFLAFLQLIIHKPYPYVYISPNRTAVNLFFSNENELGEPMACMLIIYMVRRFVKKEKKYLIRLFLLAALLYLNDAKLCILGVAAGGMITCLYMRTLRQGLVRKGGHINLIMAFIVILFIVGILSVSDFSLKFRDYNIGFNELFLDYVLRIIRMESFTSGGGSMIDRTNAIIYGLRELRRSFFFGIGFGNSTYMLNFPQYRLLTAASMHNIFFQLICEFGYVAIVGYFLIGKNILKKIMEDARWQNVLKLVYGISFILISSQSSIGILSNYMTWAITFYVVLFDTKKNKNSSIAIKKGEWCIC